jgi:Flp pilus assembly protein TadB
VKASQAQLNRARRSMRLTIAMFWATAAVVLVIALVVTMPLWLRLLLVALALVQVVMILVWRFARDRMNATYPE